jgi:hypothetical protein
MEAEGLELKGLYSSLAALGKRSAEAESLDARPVDPPTLYELGPPVIDSRNLRRAVADLTAARVQADALSRAEARLDAGLVSRVFDLATKVIRASADTSDKRELSQAMSAFGAAVAGLREQQEPPHGSRAIPLPHFDESGSVTKHLATKADIDAGAGEAADRLQRVREIATRRAKEISARHEVANARNRALYGVVPVFGEPSSVAPLIERAAAIDVSSAAVQRGDEIDAMWSGFEDAMAGSFDYNAAKERVSGVRAELNSASKSLPL